VLQPLINLVILVYERVGNFGLAFVLVIVIINLYGLWRSFPGAIQNRMRESDTSKLGGWRVWQNALKINRVIFSIVFGTFAAEITLAPVVALWLKIFSSIVVIALLISLIVSLWVLVARKPF
jgi:hypothetical protein